MTNKADDYRKKAENCERLAGKSTLLEAERKLREVAQSWREMAAQSERDEKPT
jgi:hypothetical protein